MNFQIASAGSERIVLKRGEYNFVNVVVLLMGIILAPIGSWILVNSIGADAEFSFIGFFLAAFGIIMFVAGGFALPAQYKRIPQELVFNNKDGVVEVRMGEQNHFGYIPYSDIEGFGARTITPDKFTSEEQVSRHKVWMKKKDGATWDLMSGPSYENAKKMNELLRNEVQLSVPPNPSLKNALTDKIKAADSGGKAFMYWRGSFQVGFVMVLVFTLLIVVCAVKAILGLGMNFVPGATFAVVALGMCFLVYKMFQAARRQYGITIDHQELCYFEFSQRSGHQKKRVSIPLSEIGRVLYVFSPEERGANQIMVLTHNNVGYLQEVSDDPLKPFRDLFNGRKQPLSFTLDGLDPVDCLSVETWLEEKITHWRGGSDML